MKIAINEIIQDAFNRCTLVGDGMSVTGTQAAIGLKELGNVLAELNTLDYIAENVKSLDVTTLSNRIRFVDRYQDGFHCYDNYDLALVDVNEGKYSAGDLIYVLNEEQGEEQRMLYKILCIQGAYGLQGLPVPATELPDVVLDVVPDRVISVAREVGEGWGERWIPLYPSNSTHIDTFTKQTMPVTYTTMQSTKSYAGKTITTFDIVLNSSRPYEYRITYLGAFPTLTLDSYLDLNPKTLSMLTSGLCLKLATRYKFTDYISVFEKEFSNIKRAVKTINKANRPLVYDHTRNGDPLGAYWNGFAPLEWS